MNLNRSTDCEDLGQRVWAPAPPLIVHSTRVERRGRGRWEGSCQGSHPKQPKRVPPAQHDDFLLPACCSTPRQALKIQGPLHAH